MKFHGRIGFWSGDVETSPGVWKAKIIERPYKGEILRNYRRFQNTENQNDNLVLQNQFSILADLYARENFDSIRYILWQGVAWKVTNVRVTYPRLLLDVGEVYSGERPETTA